MTRGEYQQLCDRLAHDATRYAQEKAADEAVIDTDVACPKCERTAGQPCKFPIWDSGRGHDAPEGFVHNARAVAATAAQYEHRIDVFLDEHLPDVDADALLEVTRHAKAFEESAGRPAPSVEIAAFHAFQADVWDAIDRGTAT